MSKGTIDASGYNKSCAESGHCNHRKHGYTRKDRPAPRERVKPAAKSEADLKVLAAAHTCWCNAPKKAEPKAGEVVR